MKIWKYIARALGNKTSNEKFEADIVALIRLIIILQAIITNVFIVAGVIRHW